MIRMLSTLISLLCATALTGDIAAQCVSTPVSADTFEYGYLRIYTDSDIDESDPPPAIGEFEGYAAGVLKPLDAVTMTNDFQDFADAYAGQFFQDAEDMPHGESVDDLGEEAYEYIGEVNDLPIALLVMWDGQVVLIAANLGESESGEANDLAEWMLSVELVESNIAFDKDGTSTGGPFNLTPAGGDEVVDRIDSPRDVDLLDEGM